MKVSCIMPTTPRRRWCIPHAIRYWARQDYPDKELVIICDEGSVDDLVMRDPRIRYVELPEKKPLSEKFNIGVRMASHDTLALWADDDWNAPWRLTYTLTQLLNKPGAEIAGLRKMLFHKIGTDKTWVYDRSGDPKVPYFLGGSLVFRRRYWERHPFPTDRDRHADSSFTNSIDPDEYARVAVILDDFTFYVAMNHHDNAGRSKNDPLPRNIPKMLGWSWFDGDIREVMGDDADLYLPASP